ncbi:MAG: hypothetical protein ACYC5N_00425 [Endomicrobiales bacterium]
MFTQQKGSAVSRFRYLWLLLGFVLPTAAYAQAMVVEPLGGFLNGPRFFVALIAGLVLAVAFQMILTNLSVASGLEMMRSVTSPEKGAPSGGGPSAGVGPVARKISSGFGMWAMITASISLFFASWLGVRLSLTNSAAVGAIMGLVIWGVFYIVALSLETTAVSSLVGAMAGVVRRGFRSAYEAATAAFSPSAADTAEETARKVTQAVREEMGGGQADTRRQLTDLIGQLKSKPSFGTMARSLSQALSQAEVKFASTEEGRDRVEQFLEKEGKMSPQDAQSVAKALQGMVARAAGIEAPEKEAKSYRARVEDFLRSKGKDELNRDNIKREIEELINSPKTSREVLRVRVAEINRSSVSTLLAQRKDLSQEETKRVADRIDQVLQTMKTGPEAAGAAQQARESIQPKIRDFLNSLNRPELRYEGIKSDVMKMLHDPSAGAESLINRFKSLSKDDITAIISSRSDIPKQDVDHIASQIESARDELIHKAEQTKEEVRRRIEAARAQAMRQAEEARKTAATAAWWVLLSAVVSGIFAAVGGAIGAI